MTVAACLLLYGMTVAALGPRLLVRLTHAGLAPRLGLTVWLVAIGSVVGSWVVAAALLAGELVRDWDRPGQVLGSCFAALRSVAAGRYGLLVQLGLLALAAAAALAVGVLAARLTRSLARARTSTHHHARLARLTGRRMTGDATVAGAVVIDAPQRVAYCVAGRPHTIVVTSAALDALDDRQLGAVLAHERAHLAGRHHLILAVTRGLATLLPRVTLFTAGATEVARLVEMCADDTAARTHGSHTVLDALPPLSGAGSPPAGALSATGTAVLARAERLADPPEPARRWRARLLLTTAAVLLLAGPLLVGTLAAAGLAFCVPMAG